MTKAVMACRVYLVRVTSSSYKSDPKRLVIQEQSLSKEEGWQSSAERESQPASRGKKLDIEPLVKSVRIPQQRHSQSDVFPTLEANDTPHYTYNIHTIVGKVITSKLYTQKIQKRKGSRAYQI